MEGGTEELIGVEPPRLLMVGFLRTEIVNTEHI